MTLQFETTADRRRAVLFAVPGLLVAAVVLVGLFGLPAFGHPLPLYPSYINAHAQAQRHVSNLVVAVVFDYRGVDTLGEELILFASVTGTALLLRSSREQLAHTPTDPAPTAAVRGYGGAVVPAVVMLGLWTIAFGYITPGGGFQGGVIAGSAALLVWMVGSYRTFHEVAPELLIHLSEGVGIIGFIAVGLVSLPSHSPYLTNVLALGTAGTLTSGGTIAVLNAFTGIAVGAGLVLLFYEFLQEHLQTLPEVTGR